MFCSVDIYHFYLITLCWNNDTAVFSWQVKISIEDYIFLKKNTFTSIKGQLCKGVVNAFRGTENYSTNCGIVHRIYSVKTRFFKRDMLCPLVHRFSFYWNVYLSLYTSLNLSFYLSIVGKVNFLECVQNLAAPKARHDFRRSPLVSRIGN